MRSLDQFKSLSKSVSEGPPRTFTYSSRPPESTLLGSLENLKLTAEKLVKEQASVKTDLEMAIGRQQYSNLMHRHETPHVEIANAHDDSVWDLQWHPIGYILCRSLGIGLFVITRRESFPKGNSILDGSKGLGISSEMLLKESLSDQAWNTKQ